MKYELPPAKNLAGELSPMCDKPDLIVDSGDLPATARKLRDLLSHSGRFFDRGVPVKVVHPRIHDRAPTDGVAIKAKPDRNRGASTYAALCNPRGSTRSSNAAKSRCDKCISTCLANGASRRSQVSRPRRCLNQTEVRTVEGYDHRTNSGARTCQPSGCLDSLRAPKRTPGCGFCARPFERFHFPMRRGEKMKLSALRR